MKIPIEILPDPFAVNIWGSKEQLSRDLVSVCLQRGLIKTLPLLPEESHSVTILHAMRVANFVVHGWTDPIDVEIQFTPEKIPYAWPNDGVHRIAAARYLGHIEVVGIYHEAVEQMIRSFT